MTSKKITLKKSLLVVAVAAGLALTGCKSSNERTQQTQQQKSQLEQRAVEQIKLTELYTDSQITAVTMSKDGKYLAFLKKVNGANNLHLLSVGQPIEKAQAVTSFADGIDEYQWSHRDGELIISKDLEGNELTQIFVLSFDVKKLKNGHSLKRITPNDDTRYMLMEQLSSEPALLSIASNHINKRQFDVYKLNIDTSELTRVYENKHSFMSMQMNDNGDVVMGGSAQPDNSRIVYAKVKGHWQKVLKTQPGEEITTLHFDEQNNKALMQAALGSDDLAALLELNLETGKFKKLHSDPKKYADLEYVLLDDEGVPFMAAYYGGRLENYGLTAQAKTGLAAIKKHFSSEDIDIRVNSIDHEKNRWNISIQSSLQPTRSYVYEANTNTFIDLLNQAPSIDPERLGSRQSITYTARDGVEIQAYLTLPKYQTKNLPTIILPHGGPWARDFWHYDGNYFNSVAHFFANRGYAVLQPNFRGSTGFGKNFINIAEKNWGRGTMQHDLTDGVNYLVESGIADKKRVGIMGGSYGGYAALAGVTFTPEVYKAAVSYVGPSSLVTLMESFPDVYRPYLGQWFTSVGDPLIAADLKDMNYRSPINYVDNIKTPLMLLQGANDPRVTQLESDNIAREMHQSGLPVEYYLAKDEGHGFQNQDNKLASILAMENFFAKHLGGGKSNKVNKEVIEHLATLKVDVSTL